MTIAVYKIKNKINLKEYIGSSINVEKRIKRHINELNNNVHHNINLQEDFNEFKMENFEFIIIESFDFIDREDLFAKEQHYIEKGAENSLLYNIAEAKFGDTLTRAPNREERIKKIKTTLNKTISNMSEEERKEKWGKSGENNPNWNSEVNHFCLKCNNKLSNSTIHRRGNFCYKCVDRKGGNNSFFGKKHSEEVKAKLREIAKNRPKFNNKKVSIDNIVYESLTFAAKCFNVSLGTVHFRIKSKNFPTWFYVE